MRYEGYERSNKNGEEQEGRGKSVAKAPRHSQQANGAEARGFVETMFLPSSRPHSHGQDESPSQCLVRIHLTSV